MNTALTALCLLCALLCLAILAIARAAQRQRQQILRLQAALRTAEGCHLRANQRPTQIHN